MVRALFLCACLALMPTGVDAGPAELCASAEDPWARLTACTEVIESGSWPGVQAGWAFSNRAMAHAKLGNHLDAFDDHDRAIKLDPFNPRAWNNRATSHADFREYARAERDYTKALDLDPEYTTALINRASLYLEWDKPELARADYDQAIKLEAEAGQSVAWLTFSRADAACAMGDWAAAYEDRLAAFDDGSLPVDLMEETLRQKGYLPEGTGFEAGLEAWSRAGCPWD